MKDNISDNKWLALGTWYINMWVAYEEESMFLFLHIFVFSLNSSRNEAMGSIRTVFVKTNNSQLFLFITQNVHDVLYNKAYQSICTLLLNKTILGYFCLYHRMSMTLRYKPNMIVMLISIYPGLRMIFLAHLATGNVSFCHHLASVVR